eukprot:1969273-Pyramimonas_sp.AAC.1
MPPHSCTPCLGALPPNPASISRWTSSPSSPSSSSSSRAVASDSDRQVAQQRTAPRPSSCSHVLQ